MANFTYDHAKPLLGPALLKIDGTHDLRLILVMTDTTAHTEFDKATIDAFTALDEYDGGGYARVALSGEAWTKDALNRRSELDASDAVFASLGVGNRKCQGAILYRHVTDDSDSVPVAWYDEGGLFPFNGDGTDFTLTWDAQGLLHMAQ